VLVSAADLQDRCRRPDRHRSGQCQSGATGYYMLFIVDNLGVPSIATFVRS
jgi:hypothetical protein